MLLLKSEYQPTAAKNTTVQLLEKCVYNSPIMASSETFKERYANLNPAQKKAVDTIEGPVMVVAGPGSGKTEILSLRVANILAKTQARPNNILCLTFTDLAAINMRKRLVPLLGVDAYRVAIHTFHDFCVDVIGRFPDFFYGGATFRAADELVQIEVLEEIFKEMAYDNPLKSVHPEEGFVYLKDAESAISYLKKAGLTPAEFVKVLEHNEQSLDYLNPLLDEVFSARIGKEIVVRIEHLVKELKAKKEKPLPVPYWKTLKESVVDLLELALRQSELAEKPSSVFSDWKANRLEKNDNGKYFLKETERLEKMKGLAEIYRLYKTRLWDRGYYDFDDMILDVIGALEGSAALRAELQEQFQYVLVDEFQDTNDAQMRLLRNIVDAPINEGRPNLMVVGDDDQAIFKFQGAEISNILNFQRSYKDSTIVTMASNYRSTQNILDVAQHVIRKGEQRLEKLIPEMEKTLKAENKKMKEGMIVRKTLASSEEEYSYVASEAARLIESGVSPSEIAIIARKHWILESIVPHLHKAGVPIRYERQQNVLDEPHIHQIIQIARFAASVVRKNTAEADDLLPEILSYPFWKLSRLDVWTVSAQASGGEKVAWLETMRKSDNKRVSDIADFLMDLSVRSLYEPLEYIVDRIVGAHVRVTDESDEDEEISSPFDALPESTGNIFHSPFKQFYFSKERFEKNKGEYLTFLSSLRVFMRALREYRQGEMLKIEDLMSYVDVHKKNGLLVTDNSPYVSSLNSVQLLSAHKAKGLEFETVFVLSCEDSVWASRGISSKLPMPINLPIAPAGDDFDDKLRLFFVAITRAKRHLYLTASQKSDKGDESLQLQFLADVPVGLFNESAEVNGPERKPEIIDVLADSWRAIHNPPSTIEEKTLLGSLLENYQMSVTHLNNFLDVSKGGPQTFLELNLLRFPQAKTPAASYGTAVHATIERIYSHLRTQGNLPDKEKIIGFFDSALKKERLGDREYKEQFDRGSKSLGYFYDQKRETFSAEHKIEVNFKNQGVVIDGAHLSGKIDKIIDLGGGELEVHDYKTGKSVKDWKGAGDYEKIKLNNYARQLVFYKILVEQSRDFLGKYKVHSGVIEFVESANKHDLIDLSLTITQEMLERTAKLIGIVYRKIINLDFPDISKYPQTIEGNLAFEQDLLAEYSN
jgi:DNA helicase-2/ATP-dependent DNA helicase PcrA